MNDALYRQTLISDIILHGGDVELLSEIVKEIDTEELEHILSLLIQSSIVKAQVFNDDKTNY